MANILDSNVLFGFWPKRRVLADLNSVRELATIHGITKLMVTSIFIVPLSKPALAALAIFSFRNAWADFIWPLLITNDIQLYTMELGLGMFQNRFVVEYGSITAGSVISIIPIITVFIFFRKHIIESITLTGLKG